MPVIVHTGVLKELGTALASVSDDIAFIKHSYVEFTDGRMLRNLSVSSGMDTKLDGAVASQATVELHVIQIGDKPGLLLALKMAGKIFSIDPQGSSFILTAFTVAATLFGVLLIPFYGIGLVILYVAYRMWKSLKMQRQIRAYVRALPNAIHV